MQAYNKKDSGPLTNPYESSVVCFAAPRACDHDVEMHEHVLHGRVDVEEGEERGKRGGREGEERGKRGGREGEERGERGGREGGERGKRGVREREGERERGALTAGFSSDMLLSKTFRGLFLRFCVFLAGPCSLGDLHGLGAISLLSLSLLLLILNVLCYIPVISNRSDVSTGVRPGAKERSPGGEAGRRPRALPNGDRGGDYSYHHHFI